MLKMKINRNKIIIFLSIIFFFIPTLVRAEPLKLGGSDSINTSTTSSMGDGISDVMGIALSIPEYAELVLDRINQTLQIFLKDGEYLLIQKTVPIVDANSGLLVASKYEQYIQSVKAIVSGIDKFESSQININGSGVKYVEFVAKNPFSSFKLLVFTDPNYDYQVIVIEEKAAPMSEQVLNLLNSIQFSLSGQPTSQEGSDGIAMQNSTQDIANLPVPLYKQNDPAWSCEQIGTCTCASAKCGFPNTTTIGDIGCYLTSQSMMFQYFTYGTYKNPSQYNQCLKEVNGFLTTAACNQGKCGLPYNRTVPGCTPSTVSFHKYYTLSTGPLNLALIDDDLRAGYPVLGGMEGHYFVIIGKQGTDYVVNDPIGGLRTRAPSVLINFSLYRGPMPYPDIVKPVTTISLNGVVGENYWYKSHVTMILNATDDRTGIREIQYSYDNENWYSYPYSPVQLNRIGLEVPIYYRAIDNAGNVEDVKVTYYNSDPIAPSNPTSVNPGCGAVSGEWQNACSDPNFSWSGASDDTSGLSLYQYYWGPDPFGTTGTTTSDSLYDPPPTVVLGMDPGANTGVAVYVDGQLVELLTIPPHHIERTLAARMPSRVVFEDSRLQSHTWTRGKTGAASAKMARNVGQVDARCADITAHCADLGIPAHGISPAGKGGKLDARRFAAVTGWTGPSNEHSRDAAMVAWPYRRAADLRGGRHG